MMDTAKPRALVTGVGPGTGATADEVRLLAHRPQDACFFLPEARPFQKPR